MIIVTFLISCTDDNIYQIPLQQTTQTSSDYIQSEAYLSRVIYEIENRVEEHPQRQNIHRTYLRLSMIKNQNIYLKKAIGYAISQVHFNQKPFNETLIHLFRRLHLLYFFKMIIFRPKSLINFLISIFFILKMRLLK